MSIVFHVWAFCLVEAYRSAEKERRCPCDAMTPRLAWACSACTGTSAAQSRWSSQRRWQRMELKGLHEQVEWVQVALCLHAITGCMEAATLDSRVVAAIMSTASRSTAGDTRCKCLIQSRSRHLLAISRDPKDHINIRLLETMISGIPLLASLGTRMSDPYVCFILDHIIPYHTTIYRTIMYYTIIYHTTIYHVL